MSKLPLNILLSTPACLTRIAKCWQSQLLSIFLGITHLFSNQVCKSGIAYPLLVRRKVFSKNTADFHGDGYFPAERRYFQRLTNRFEGVQNTLTSVWMLTLNTVVFKLILHSLKRKRHFNHTPSPLYFQRCRFTS